MVCLAQLPTPRVDLNSSHPHLFFRARAAVFFPRAEDGFPFVCLFFVSRLRHRWRAKLSGEAKLLGAPTNLMTIKEGEGGGDSIDP